MNVGTRRWNNATTEEGCVDSSPEEVGMMKTKVLGISGSLRRHGNSEFLLEQALEAAKAVAPDSVETVSFSMVGKKMAGCTCCLKCADLEGECVQKDDFQGLRDKWYEADVVLYSLPVYHMCVPGQLRCFIDRLGNASFCYYDNSVPKVMKVIGAIAQGMHIFSGQENVIMQIINHALLMGCIPVTGDGPECYIGAGGWTSNEIRKDALRKQAAEGQLDATMTVKGTRSLAKRAVELAFMVKSGAEIHRDHLAGDPMYEPFLKRIGITG
jgi:multimeric flavodoxin WrbA